VPVGTPCVVQALLHGNGTSASPGDIEVACSGKALYRSSDTFSGVSNTSSHVEQSPVASSSDVTYSLIYQDQGARSGRAQVSLDTTEHAATVWRDGGYRVKLTVDEQSAPVTGTPLIDVAEGGFSRPITRTGKIKSAEGTVLFAAGATCTVEVRPVRGGPQNCRVRVRCGGTIAYGEGNGGYNECSVEGTTVIAANDARGSGDDRDPILDMNLAHGTVSVSDDGASPWTVKILLDPEKR
jgi:hypothetical protein